MAKRQKTISELMREQDKKIREGQARAYRRNQKNWLHRAMQEEKNQRRPSGNLIEHRFMQHYNKIIEQCDHDIAAEHEWRNTPR